MKILLVQGTPYVPALHGASKANRLLLEGLAVRGHQCRALALASSAPSLKSHEQILRAFSGKTDTEINEPVFSRLSGVDIHAVGDGSQLRGLLLEQLREFEPDLILVSAEDTAQILLNTALKVRQERVVYLAHTSICLPFGPDSPFPSSQRTKLLGKAAGIIAVSDYLKHYIKRWGSLDAETLYFPAYGAGPFPNFGRFESGFVTIINPCAFKGISIFTALAERLPEVEFAAVPTWGTTEEDHAELARFANIRILKPTPDIDKIFALTRVLLVPSLYHEAFGLVAVEAMLRGIPVLASDHGGLREAKLGIDYSLPVRPIESQMEHGGETQDADSHVIVPPQEIGPWLAALQALLTDRRHYEHLSAASRTAGLEFLERIGCERFEQYFTRLMQKDAARSEGQMATHFPLSDLAGPAKRLDSLSAEKRAILALRLRRKK